MKVGGFQPFSLCDYDGGIAAVVFTQGCNFRCPFCHNGSLIPSLVQDNQLIPIDSVLAKLEHRRGKIDGVVISGGEPTLQPDLGGFLRVTRQMGFATKLDTNGSQPEILRQLLESGLVDYVAMDVKAPWRKYGTLTGKSAPPIQQISRSIQLIHDSRKPHEFRTTVVDSLLSSEDLAEVRAMIPADSPWKAQRFRPEHAFDPALRILGSQRGSLTQLPSSASV